MVRKRANSNIMPGSAITLTLSKLDVAEAHIKVAVNLFFQNAHPAPIYALASAAREILTTIGTKKGVETSLHELATIQGKTLKEIISVVHAYASFLKHADRDQAATLVFPEIAVDIALDVACSDFTRITDKVPVEVPVELFVFQMWGMAFSYERVSHAPRKHQPTIKYSIAQFPGLRSATTREQAKKIGLNTLHRYQRNPGLVLKFGEQIHPIKAKSNR